VWERTPEIFTSILDVPCVNELLGMAMLTNQKKKKSQKLNEAIAQRGASNIYSPLKIIRVFKCKGTIRVGL